MEGISAPSRKERGISLGPGEREAPGPDPPFPHVLGPPIALGRPATPRASPAVVLGRAGGAVARLRRWPWRWPEAKPHWSMPCCGTGGERSRAGNGLRLASRSGSSTPGTRRMGKGTRTVAPLPPCSPLPHPPYPITTPSSLPTLPSPPPLPLPAPMATCFARSHVAVRPGRVAAAAGLTLGRGSPGSGGEDRQGGSGLPGSSERCWRRLAVAGGSLTRLTLPSPHLTPLWSPLSAPLASRGGWSCGRRFPVPSVSAGSSPLSGHFRNSG